jgi:hypothetical protein
MRIVAIGGSASVGKSTAAPSVAALIGVETVIHVDELSPLVRASVPHPIDDAEDPWTRPAPDLTSELVAWTAHLHAPIRSAVDRLLGVGGVVEGEGVDPRLGLGRSDRVRPVYVIEEDRERLRSTFEQRPSSERFFALSEQDRMAVVELNYQYGQWLKRAAVVVSESWVPSQPWDSLPDRIINAALRTG